MPSVACACVRDAYRVVDGEDDGVEPAQRGLGRRREVTESQRERRHVAAIKCIRRRAVHAEGSCVWEHVYVPSSRAVCISLTMCELHTSCVLFK